MDKLKKNWSNILFIILIILMIIPRTRMPIQVFIQRLISFSPSVVDKEDREVLTDYNWKLATLNGERIDLNRSEGKVVLINMWATWCPPCVAEMPYMQELYNAYKNRVDFYFVTNEQPDKPRKFLEKKGYDIPVYLPLKREPALLDSRSLPTTFLISKTGEIIIRKSGSASWNSDRIHQLIDDLLVQ